LYFGDRSSERTFDNESRVLVDAEAFGGVAFDERPHQSHFATLFTQLAFYHVVHVEEIEATFLAKRERSTGERDESSPSHQGADRIAS
jgi:hypothetical protein